MPVFFNSTLKRLDTCHLILCLIKISLRSCLPESKIQATNFVRGNQYRMCSCLSNRIWNGSWKSSHLCFVALLS